MKIYQGPALNEREYYQQELLEHGVLVFRGYPVHSVADFEEFAKKLDPNIAHYHGQTNREQISNHVYETTPLPKYFAVAPHSETSYSNCFPQRGFFYCEEAPHSGGETSFVDNRIMLKSLAPDLLARFREKGVYYRRNLPSQRSLLLRVLRLLKVGFVKGWEEMFFTDDVARLENFCRENHIPVKWLAGDWLSLNIWLPATRIHPVTKDEVWFNQASTFRITKHTHGLVGYYLNSLTQFFSKYTLLDASWGDGSAFRDDEILAIKEAYSKNMFLHQWQKGDVVFLDNLLMSHGRKPTQDRRKVYAIFSSYITGEEFR